MRTPLVRHGATAVVIAAVFGLATACNPDATPSQSAATTPSPKAAPTATDEYKLMVKPPNPAGAKYPVKAVRLGVMGKDKDFGPCIPIEAYPKYTDTGLYAHRGDTIEAMMFMKVKDGECYGDMKNTATMRGAKPQNIKGNAILFDLGQSQDGDAAPSPSAAPTPPRKAATTASPKATPTATDKYKLMVKTPNSVKGVRIGVIGKDKDFGPCIPIEVYTKYTDTGLYVHRNDTIEAMMFMKVQGGECYGDMKDTATMWGAKPQNIKGNAILFDLSDPEY